VTGVVVVDWAIATPLDITTVLPPDIWVLPCGDIECETVEGTCTLERRCRGTVRTGAGVGRMPEKGDWVVLKSM